VLAGLLALAPTAGARTAANPSLTVHFSLTGTITVTGPTGAPLGTTSGSPTVIPAGYYTVLLQGPGGCANIPYFELKGPGESIINNLTEGELDNDAVNAYFQPNSTYTWRNREAPGSLFTFVTSSDVVGSPPPVAGPKGNEAPNHTTVSSTDFVGSAILPFRGKLVASVSAAGRLSLAYGGKIVASLKAGRYTVAVTDKSSTSGLILRRGKYAPTRITGAKFVGKHSTSVKLAAGHWIFSPGTGTQSYSVAVS
jgi:hypothetical protein